MLRAAVIGAGYWGPNLVRNFRGSPRWELAAVCDLDEDRARRAAGDWTTTDTVTSVDDLLARPDIDAVAIATPAGTHRDLALAALDAGKHVLVEKPMAACASDARLMIERAERAGLTLMADHTYCYTPVVQHLASIIEQGELGDVLFVDSVRINLGLIQPDVNVFWDLAPHDLSILDLILPSGLRPSSVSATGADPIGAGQACLGYLTLSLPDAPIANVHVNWLSPTKIRHMVIGGSRRTAVWDDLNPQQRLSIYDRGVDLDHSTAQTDLASRRAANVNYRLGDMYAPSLPEREALGAMVAEFAAAITEGRTSRTSGQAGLRVLEVLEASDEALAGSTLREMAISSRGGTL